MSTLYSKMMGKQGYRLPLVLTLGMVLGFSAVVIPGLLTVSSYPATPLFPQVRAGIEAMPSFSYFLLFLIGALLGILEPEHPRLIGLSSIIAFPIITVGEKAIDISSHPQMAWEITYYLALSLATMLGAYLGKELRS